MADKICPIMSAGAVVTRCRKDCKWYRQGFGSCAIERIANYVYEIADLVTDVG